MRLLAAVCFCVLGALGAAGDDGHVIASPRTTHLGTWHSMESCPPSHLVFGLQLKVQPWMGPAEDDTAVNGVRLLCAAPTGREVSATVASGVGGWGTWREKVLCASGFAVGFQLRTDTLAEADAYDNTATNDVRLFCSDGSEVTGGGVEFTHTEWTEARRCPEGLAVCGLRTQLDETGVGDDATGINNVDMKCCPPPDA